MFNNRSFLVFIILFFLTPFHLVAESWKWLGPPGGQIELILPDQGNPKIWYVVNYDQLYRSEDGGLLWQDTKVRVAINFSDEVPYSLPISIHPVTSEVLAISANRPGKLLASSDKGKTFQLRSNLQFPLRTVLFHPHNPNIVYGFGLPKYDFGISKDRGRTWETFRNLSFKKQDICSDCKFERYFFHDLFISPLNPEIMFISGDVTLSQGQGHEYEEYGASYLWRSENGGASWKIVNEGERYKFSYDPYNDRLFAFNSVGISLLTSRGIQLLSGKPLNQIVAVPGRTGELIGTYSGKAFRSIDGGHSWKDYPLNGLGVYRIRLQPLQRDNLTLMVGTDGTGMFKGNAENGYKVINNGFHNNYVFDLEVAEGTNPILYVLLPNSGFGQSSYFFRSIDRGRTWTDITSRAPVRWMDTVVANPKNGSHLVMADSSGIIWISRNSGQTWKRSNFKSHLCCYWHIAFNPKNPQEIFVTADERTMYKSEDGGLKFRKLFFTYHGINQMVIDENDPRIMYFVTQDGLYKSENGATPIEINSGIRAACPQCDVMETLSIAPLGIKDGYAILVANSENNPREEIYKTLDGCKTWQKIGNGPAAGASYATIHSADVQGLHFYLTHPFSNYIYETHDAGNSWENIAIELGNEISISEISDTRRFPLFISTDRGIYLPEVNGDEN
jgi:photosystem II stability/assembly factor-like uncharacterized protein